MGSREIDALIIRHLADIEAAGRRGFELDTEVFKVLGKTAEKWANKVNWQGNFDIEGDGFWLNPPDWKLSGKTEEDDESWLGYFDFDVGADDDLEANDDKGDA